MSFARASRRLRCQPWARGERPGPAGRGAGRARRGFLGGRRIPAGFDSASLPLLRRLAVEAAARSIPARRIPRRGARGPMHRLRRRQPAILLARDDVGARVAPARHVVERPRQFDAERSRQGAILAVCRA